MSWLYMGRRTELGCRVTVQRYPAIKQHKRPLPPRRLLVNHSPTGFEWGYAGSGPAQLALAILAYELRDDEQAVRLHQVFKRRVIAQLPRGDWQLTSEQVRGVLAEIGKS